MADPGVGVPWVPRNPPFVVLRACVAGLIRAHERSRKCSGQRNPPFQNPRSATEQVHVHMRGEGSKFKMVEELKCLLTERQVDVADALIVCV